MGFGDDTSHRNARLVPIPRVSLPCHSGYQYLWKGWTNVGHSYEEDLKMQG